MSEELPNELNKLEIAPGELHELGLTPLKLIDNTKLPLILNPFYEDDKKSDGDSIEMTSTQASVTPGVRSHSNCRRCRLRRRSESLLDEYRANATLTTNINDTSCVTHSTPGVQRQPLKKTASSGGMNRKSLIREPVLCALQSCMHVQNVRRKLQTTASVNKEAAAGAAHTGKPLPQATTTVRGMIDFSDLIVECQSLLEQETQSHRTKNFTRMQSPAMGASARPVLSGNKMDGIGAGNTAGSGFFSNSIIQRNASSPSPEHSAIARASTSCSQQAGNEAASAASNCDDVTIDELASYFETLVHIPKKMSSMAEMMYI